MNPSTTSTMNLFCRILSLGTVIGIVACGGENQQPVAKPRATSAASTNKINAGRYTDYYTRNPLTSLKPFEPQPLFYALLYNCGNCHEFTRALSSITPKLEKNKANGSIQDIISSGSMPPNNPNFAKSDAGKELLDMLNKL